MEQFELRFIVCGSNLATTRTYAQSLFDKPLPGKLTLRQDGQFLYGALTIHYEKAETQDQNAALISDIVMEIQLQERVEAVLSESGLSYCIFEGSEINSDSQFGEMAQALGSELLFQSIWQSEQIDRYCAEHLPSLTRDRCLGRVISFAKKALAQQVWDESASGKAPMEPTK